MVDEVDKQILKELTADRRKSFNEISLNVGKTEATVRRRVKRLLDDGIIKRFTIEFEIDSKAKTRATIKILPDFTEIKKILVELKKIKEIKNIWRLSGNCGRLIKVEISSIEQINPLIEEKISQIQGVKIMETCFITDVIKG